MNFKDISKKVNSAILCLMAHPDNEPDSEFADRIDDLIDVKEQIDQVNGVDKIASNCNLADVSNRRELFDKFYAWLDGLTQEEYDDMSLTDKCEKFFFKT